MQGKDGWLGDLEGMLGDVSGKFVGIVVSAFVGGLVVVGVCVADGLVLVEGEVLPSRDVGEAVGDIIEGAFVGNDVDTADDDGEIVANVNGDIVGNKVVGASDWKRHVPPPGNKSSKNEHMAIDRAFPISW